MNHHMMNTQALDALAALCGAATNTAVPTPAPSSNTAVDVNSNNASSFALIARQLQENQQAQAQAQAQVQAQARQAQAQAQAQQSARQAAALSTVPPEVLQAYLTAAGQRNHHHQGPSPSDIAHARNLSLHQGAGAGFTSGPSGGLAAAFASLTRPAQADPNSEARAIALKIIMAQQQHQQQQAQQQHQQQQQQQQQLLQQPQHQLHYALPSPSISANTSPPAPPTLAAANQSQIQAAVGSALQYHPQSAALSSSSPSSFVPQTTSGPQPQHAVSDNTSAPTTQDTSRDENLKQPSQVSSSLPPVKRPPPKKRHVRSKANSRALGGGGGLGDPALKSVISEWEDKKQAKRAANRLSAHLSRKRKKMLISDLKDENLELRRKEQILQFLPDLIIVFDSSGLMPFVSSSVTRFLDYSPQELEDASFWDLLTVDSVQLIKSAFMDALAVKRSQEEDSTPLCDGGSMTVELVDKDGDHEGGSGRLVSLKGVVHFAGESPECVCSIRPEGRGRKRRAYSPGGKNEDNASSSMNVSSLSEESSGSAAQQRRNSDRVVAAGASSHRISDVDSIEKPDLIEYA